jgi:hypothetical protein
MGAPVGAKKLYAVLRAIPQDVKTAHIELPANTLDGPIISADDGHTHGIAEAVRNG